MTDLQRALAAFWSHFAPAYVSGMVPDSAAFPYITYDVTAPDALGYTVLAATVWCRKADGFDAQAQCDACLDRIAAGIPVEGVMLAVGDGFALLERNDAEFQSICNDPEDRALIGGRTSCILRHYNI